MELTDQIKREIGQVMSILILPCSSCPSRLLTRTAVHLRLLTKAIRCWLLWLQRER
jgi:hypothetical protein